MPVELCDCGFEIPYRASFCPGCGKPLTLEARERERIANAFQRPEEQEETEPVSSEITFGTPGVLRACYWSAALGAILISLPSAILLCFLIYPATGFYSVHSYRRQTKKKVSLRGGAKLGFLTGTITFALLLILMAIVSIVPGPEPTTESASSGMSATFDQLEKMFQEEGRQDLVTQLREVRRNPTALALMVVMSLMFLFGLTTAFTTVGGALGAKVLEKD